MHQVLIKSANGDEDRSALASVAAADRNTMHVEQQGFIELFAIFCIFGSVGLVILLLFFPPPRAKFENVIEKVSKYLRTL